MVDDGSHVVDQSNDVFGHRVARRCFACKDHRAWHPIGARVGQHGLVARHDMQQVEQLALVFVDALDLHVKKACGVHRHTRAGQDVLGQALLVGQFYRHESFAEFDVFCQGPQA